MQKLERSYQFLQSITGGLSDKDAYEALNKALLKEKGYEEVLCACVSEGEVNQVGQKRPQSSALRVLLNPRYHKRVPQPYVADVVHFCQVD